MALDYNDIIRSDSHLIQEQTLLFFQMQKKIILHWLLKMVHILLTLYLDHYFLYTFHCFV